MNNITGFEVMIPLFGFLGFFVVLGGVIGCCRSNVMSKKEQYTQTVDHVSGGKVMSGGKDESYNITIQSPSPQSSNGVAQFPQPGGTDNGNHRQPSQPVEEDAASLPLGYSASTMDDGVRRPLGLINYVFSSSET